LGAAIEYVNGLGMDNIAAQEHALLAAPKPFQQFPVFV
jgi:hypothetical protein